MSLRNQPSRELREHAFGDELSQHIPHRRIGLGSLPTGFVLTPTTGLRHDVHVPTGVAVGAVRVEHATDAGPGSFGLVGRIPCVMRSIAEKETLMAEYNGPVCALCAVKACSSEPGVQKPPTLCPMLAEAEVLREVENAYLEKEELRRLALESARTEAAGYCRATRVEEIMDFARRIGAQKLGIAHCIGLTYEAGLARRIFLAGGFEVYTVCCKVGSIDKGEIGLQDEEKVRPGQYEALCNPVGQAAVLAAAGTQLNVVVGLCVGHDSLFFMHSKAPATVLVVKDRVLGHNPVAALYTSQSYYSRLVEK